MDTNGGLAAPCRGEALIEAIRAAMVDVPDARFEGNQLGNVVVTEGGRFVGVIDVRALGVDEESDPRGCWEDLRR